MSAPVPIEERLLADVGALIDAVLAGDRDDHDARLDLLEAVAAQLGGFSLGEYRCRDGLQRRLTERDAMRVAPQIVNALSAISVHPSLALTSLARAPLTHTQRRRAGAYYTDFRLARFLSARLSRRCAPGESVIDPASGTGILLVAAALSSCDTQAQTDRFIAQSAHAADLSAPALRAVKLALASLTSDLDAIDALSRRLRTLDSLMAGPDGWSDVAPGGFDLVIANPPWEKLKLSRHEHLAAAGLDRHYGAEYDGTDLTELRGARERMSSYTSQVSALHELSGGGETDLYKLFLSLAVQLTKPGGQLAMLVPAGLIRAQGARALRAHLLEHAADLRIAVLSNGARFFSIDTRFKFLAVHAVLDPASAERPALRLDHARGASSDVELTGSASIGRAQLRRSRPDLSIPEVRSSAEWRLYRRMCANGVRLGAPGNVWEPKIVREVDMTRDRPLFMGRERAGALPVIEGRMVHHFRHTAKSYVAGSGRRAKWDTNDFGDGALQPQFWLDPDDLTPAIRVRTNAERIGFCDIAGQTNERSMMAALIPAGVVCGNKVPTVTLANTKERSVALLWLAVANSLAFDWLLRRVLSTTVNYFVLRSVPFPDLDPRCAQARRIAALVELIEGADERGSGACARRRLAELRAEIDALVLNAYGLSERDIAPLLADFPLLDRGQIPLPGESRSTVTADLVRHTLQRLDGQLDPQLDRRLASALLLGACAYVPAQFTRVAKHALA